MNLKNINKKVVGLSFYLTLTSICSSCTTNIIDDNLISYNNLINNYKIIELTSFNEKYLHIVKKEEIKDKPNCYGYYDINYHDCIVKVDQENGWIIGNGTISNIVEMNVKDYLEMYNIQKDRFSNDDLGIIIDMIRKNYFDKEKVLVK